MLSRWRAASLGGLRAVLGRHPKIRTSRYPAGVAGSRSNDIVHDEEARGRREKAYPVASRKDAGDTKTASHGVASYYTEGTKTASGEKFNTLDMTAAHPTLPFGTKLRVTNVASGKSVTVRVNDRGPYVSGRVVDVSYSAADALGMVGKGVAKVKLDVVD